MPGGRREIAAVVKDLTCSATEYICANPYSSRPFEGRMRIFAESARDQDFDRSKGHDFPAELG
jgi:hypothetical protein